MGRVIEGTWRPLRVGNLRGLFLSSQKVPVDVLVEVLVEMLVEMLVDFRNTSLTVPGSPIWTSNLRTPSPFLVSSERYLSSPFLLAALTADLLLIAGN